jgi:hypothetical protein
MRFRAAWLLGPVALTAAFAAETGSVCVHDYAAGLSCNASGVRVAELKPVSVVESCASGDPNTAVAIFDVRIFSGAIGTLYDVGFFLALNGGSALSDGICLHDYLEPPLATSPVYGDSDLNGRPDIVHGPWLNAEPFAMPSDECGDIAAGTDAIKTLISFRFACVDSNSNGTVDVSTCASWSAGTTSRCSNLTDAFPATNARCSCETIETGVPMPVAGGRVGGLTLARSGASNLALAWGASCSPIENDYAVYEGTLGSFSSHQSVVCSTGGLTSTTIQPGAGSRYYLVVPRNNQREGSYGNTTAGPRPPAVNACVAQQAEAFCF